MLITILDLEREPLEFRETLGPEAIQYGNEIRQAGDLAAEGRADLVEEHRGRHEVVQDIRLRASYRGRIQIPCARCLEPVERALDGSFDLIFRPLGADAGPAEHAISTSDTEIGYYQGGSLTLEDVLREQVLLSLPAKTLCREDCKGLCPRCGRNLNTEACACEDAPPDPRWEALSGLRGRMKNQGS